jgi:hypothetical protein
MFHRFARGAPCSAGELLFGLSDGAPEHEFHTVELRPGSEHILSAEGTESDLRCGVRRGNAAGRPRASDGVAQQGRWLRDKERACRESGLPPATAR